MYEYIVGKISYSNTSYIVLENNFIGYKVFINKIDELDKNSFHRIYLFTKVSQNNKGNFIYDYYGFKSINEKYFFELLLTLNGIGPKTAMAILKNDISLLKNLIKTNDVETLESLPGFNGKLAIMIVNQLGYKLRNETIFKKNVDDNDLLENDSENNESKSNQTAIIADILNALKALGYKKSEIEFALCSMQEKNIFEKFNDINELISEAIKLIIDKNGYSSTKTN